MSILSSIILALGLAFSIGFMVMVLVTMSVHWNDYKYYRITYDTIMSHNYLLVRDGGQVETYKKPEEYSSYVGDEILFFKDGIRNDNVNSIKLLSNGLNYIHDRGGIDLYARYWFKKIMKARKHNSSMYFPPERQMLTGTTHIGNNFFVSGVVNQFKFFRG